MKTNSLNSELKSRAEQLSTSKTGLAPINFARRRVNRSLDTDSLIQLLRTRSPGFFAFAEVVGRWVWIQFPEKQPVEVTSRLAQLGFHWNNTRQAWQHPCGVFRDRRVKFDPRRKFGSYFAADMMTA